MKKIISMIGLLIISIGIYSCSKNNDDSLSTIKEDLSIINVKYQSSNNKITFKKLCGIIVADVGGAWAGLWAGGKIGGAIGSVVPGAGTAAGAGVGAVAGGAILGAMGSYAASLCCGGKMYDPITEEWISSTEWYIRYEERKARAARIEELLQNQSSNNPFNQSVGKRHNELLSNMIFTTNNGPIEGWNQRANMSNIENEIILNSSNLVIDNLNILQVMNSFLNGFSNIETLTTANSYISDYENYIISSNSFTSLEKETLHHGLAVARYSSHYWDAGL